MSTLLIPAANVELQLTLTNDYIITSTVTFQVYVLNDTLNEDGWDETTITWNTAPQNNTGTANGFLAGATLLGSSSVTGTFIPNQTLSFSYASMANFINADTDNRVPFMVTSQNTNANTFTFASNNNLSPTLQNEDPTLIITTVPEPTTFALLGFGLVRLVGFTRCRSKQQ